MNAENIKNIYFNLLININFKILLDYCYFYRFQIICESLNPQCLYNFSQQSYLDWYRRIIQEVIHDSIHLTSLEISRFFQHLYFRLNHISTIITFMCVSTGVIEKVTKLYFRIIANLCCNESKWCVFVHTCVFMHACVCERFMIHCWNEYWLFFSVEIFRVPAFSVVTLSTFCFISHWLEFCFSS